LVNSDYKKNTIVLRRTVDDEQARRIIEEKKTAPFRFLLKKPDRDEVHVHAVTLNYEPVIMVSGRYTADYYRSAVHPIKVDYNVTEVVLGGGVFPIQSKSKWKQALSTKKAKNKVDLILEEHAFIDDEHVAYFDHHGKEVKFNVKMDAKSVENYPSKILGDKSNTVKKPEVSDKDVIDGLFAKLSRPSGAKIRDLKEKLTINEISEIYVPVYEARLVGPKKKVEILRLDAVANRIL